MIPYKIRSTITSDNLRQFGIGIVFSLNKMSF